MVATTQIFPALATHRVDTNELFDFSSPLRVHALKPAHALSHLVPPLDLNYCFNPQVTSAILAGFEHRRRVIIQGFHGTGKSTHIEQVAARLNWPCLRVNLDGHISRMDLVGKDTITLKDGLQITEFEEGILPWALQRPMALIFDEYDAGRPDVMFVIQQVLEKEGKFTFLDQQKVLTPHVQFRIFATMNTLGQGNSSGLYHGTHLLNQAQLDRWNIVAKLNYLEHAQEVKIVLAHVPHLQNEVNITKINAMVRLATLTRTAFAQGDLTTVMSPRGVITWAENLQIFQNLQTAFIFSFVNRCDPSEHTLLGEFYQRCFDEELVLTN